MTNKACFEYFQFYSIVNELKRKQSSDIRKLTLGREIIPPSNAQILFVQEGASRVGLSSWPWHYPGK